MKACANLSPSSERVGTVMSAIPAQVDSKPVAVVPIASPEGKSTTVDVDLLSGKVVQ